MVTMDSGLSLFKANAFMLLHKFISVPKALNQYEPWPM